ncbi:uncharacterized protein LOC119187804 isoform X1 [Rhipicephalus microplus]|uniref:uncharacterized protein LOC119187804 isoform X1 n=2 Tax=Rhipicephalus microplus TaxID=6941 RepID=UPI003F6C0674
MNADQEGAWLDLKEIHSSLNDLKDKLNRTGQKLCAAASSGPIHFNFAAQPSSVTSTSNFVYRFGTAGTSSSCLVSPRVHRTSQSRGGSAVNGLTSPQAKTTEKGPILSQQFMNHSTFLHHDELDFMRSLRQSSTQSSFVPSATAITTAANVTFTLGDIVAKRSVSDSGLHVRKAHYINDEAGSLLKQDPRNSGSKSLSGSSRKLRRLVEKQKKVVDSRHTKDKSPQYRADHNRNSANVQRSLFAAQEQPTKLVDASTYCKPSSNTVATNTSVASSVEPCKPSGEHLSEADSTFCRNIASSGIVENVNLCARDFVEEYLEYLKERNSVGSDASKHLGPFTTSTVLDEHHRHKRFSGNDAVSLASNGSPIDPVWKRKFASVPQPKEYRGFSLRGAHTSTQKQVQQLSSKTDKVEDAGEINLAAVERKESSAQSAEVIQHERPVTHGKTNAGAHPAKTSVITPTSWKTGRNLALRIHGPYLAASSGKSTGVSENQLRNGASRDQAQVKRLLAGAEGEKHILSNEDKISALRSLGKSLSGKRKAQLRMEPEKESSAPATKLRHYDASAVRNFIMEQKMGRKQRKCEAEQGRVDAARARELRLEKLYAFQRKTACDSARIGRHKMRRKQEDEKAVHEFVKHLKSMQDVTDFDQKDSPPQSSASGSTAEGTDTGHNSRQVHMQLQKDSEVCVGLTQAALVSHGIEGKCLSKTSVNHLSLSSSPSQPMESDFLKNPLEGQLSSPYDLGTPILNGCKRQQRQTQEFQYEPTEQVLRLEETSTEVNEKLDEQLNLLGCNTAFQLPNYDEHHSSGITERLHMTLSEALQSVCGSFEVDDSSGWSMVFEKSSDKASSISVDTQVQNEAAKKIQNFYRKHLIQKRKGLFEKDNHKYEKNGANAALSCILEESSQRQRESRTGVSSTELSAPDEEPSRHLMPDPNTISRAWKSKFSKAFLTSTLLEDASPPLSFHLSSVSTSGAPSSRKVPAQHNHIDSGLQRENVSTSKGTSAEALTSLLEEDPTRHSSMVTGYASVTKSHSKSRAATEKISMLPVKSVSMEIDSRPSTKSLVNLRKAPKKSPRQDLEQQQPSENAETSLLPVTASRVSSRSLTGLERSGLKQGGFNNDKAWVLLEAQAKALQASAETARHLAQVRAPSLLEVHGEDMVQRLTASTVVAASALAAALACQKPDWQVSVPSDKGANLKTQASSSSSTASQPTDAGFESIDKTSPQSSAEDSCSPPTEDNAKETQRTETMSRQDDNNVGGSDRNTSSASISEELDMLGLSDSSPKNKKSTSSTSKKRQPKNVAPLSLDSSATEDSAGASKPQQACSKSSFSETVLLDRDLLSYGSLMEHPLSGRLSGKDEIEGGGQPPLALLRLQERDVIERARADLTWIEVLKRNCREKGSEERLPTLRKRQRAILIRLHQKRTELKALQRRCLTQSQRAGSPTSVSNENSVPIDVAIEVPDGSTSGMHSSGISENCEASWASDQLSDQSKESSQPDEIPVQIEQKSSVVDSYVSTFESSSTLPELPEDSTHLKLNASKRFLEKRQQKLQDRRKNVQKLLEWQKKLNAEEASVRALERRALARLRARGAKTPPQTPFLADTPTSISKNNGVVRSSTYPEGASIEEEVSEEVCVEAPPTTESIQEEAAVTEPTSGDQHESTINSKVVASASSEAEVSTQTENVIRHSSSSGGRRSPMVIKKPLVVRRKVRRDSSGSEDSFNVSLSETASDQSDIECRIIALSQELKKRQLEAEQLKQEQRRRRTEVLREREESLKKHIKLYDKLIQQAREELQKELDMAQQEKASFVKPQIKKPRAAEQRKHRLVQMSSPESGAQPALVPENKESKLCTESPVEVLSGSLKKSESEIATEEEQSNEASSFVSSGTEELTPRLATPPVTDKSPPRTSMSSTSEILEEFSSKEVSASASKGDTEQPEAIFSCASSKAVEQRSFVSKIEPVAEDSLLISAKLTGETNTQDNTSTLDKTSGASNNAEGVSVKNSVDPTFMTQSDAVKDETLLSDDAISEKICATASESLLSEGSMKDQENSNGQPVKEANIPITDNSESQNDTSEGILSSLGENENFMSHEAKNEQSCEVAPVFEKESNKELLGNIENSTEVAVPKEASSPSSSKAADAPASLSSLEDESTVTEEVAEYTEEIVRSTVIDSSLSREEAIEEGKVDKAVNGILYYLLEDTMKSLVGRQDSSIPFAEESRTVKAASSDEVTRKVQGECQLSLDSSARFGYFTAPSNQEVLSAAERNSDELHVQLTDRETLAGAVGDKMTEIADQLHSSSLEAGKPWVMEVIDVLAEKLVSEAIDSVVVIAKEKGLLTAMSVESDSHKSNVSQKVSAILASIEETRNSRELQRPQDLMVLSTDLDDEEFSWKDALTSPIFTVSEDASAEMSPKELCSKAVQAEDCFLSTTSEQDWFDDDFGLGSGDNALAYQRRIPNKPPPPYSPPKSGFMSRLFSEAVWKVPNMESEVSTLIQKAATIVYATAVQGKGLANLTFSPECVGEKAGVSGVDGDSYRAYCEFLFELVKETAQEIFRTEETDTPPPFWQRNVRLRRKRPLPATPELFISLVGSKVLSVPGLHENSELAFRNFDDRGLNFVDVLLYSEARGEEPEWVDYSREEVIVKDQVAIAIFRLLVDDTIETLKSLWQFR